LVERQASYESKFSGSRIGLPVRDSDNLGSSQEGFLHRGGRNAVIFSDHLKKCAEVLEFHSQTVVKGEKAEAQHSVNLLRSLTSGQLKIAGFRLKFVKTR
jgi:hypothetical protein